ncbi:MAG: helix-turn-helix transcriptional regulator [Clostridiales bacterium]|nr:helix-turn-helix transcriptional regulator [Clostridiales bacterium]
MAAKLEILTERLTVLAEPTRLDILMIISEAGTCCANDLLAHFDISQPTLSHHMSVLMENGLVTGTKQGRFMRYSINKDNVKELRRVLDLLCTEPGTENPSSEKKKKKSPKGDKKKKEKKKKK